MKTQVKAHLRRKKHGKSIVRHHNRRVHSRRAFINPFMKKKIREGLNRKPVYEVSTNNLLQSARNLYNRGEISLEQIGEIERRAKDMPMLATVEALSRKSDQVNKDYYDLIRRKKADIKDSLMDLRLLDSGPRYELVYGPNGRPSGVRKLW